jgi:hypothetical protein
MRYDLEEARKIPTGDPLPIGLPTLTMGQPLSATGFGALSQSIMADSLQNFTAHYGLFSPEQTKQLRDLGPKRKINPDSVEVTDRAPDGNGITASENNNK